MLDCHIVTCAKLWWFRGKIRRSSSKYRVSQSEIAPTNHARIFIYRNLQSNNRANGSFLPPFCSWQDLIFIVVAISRAKEGLFILGNSSDLSSRSEMWRSIIDDLEKENAVGDAFPVACHRHPEAIQYISNPGELLRIAPDGMHFLPGGTTFSSLTH